MSTAKRLVSAMLAVVMCASMLFNPMTATAYAAGAAPAEVTAQSEPVNLALNKEAAASSEEAPTVTAANAVDGDRTDGASRWGSKRGSGPEWIYVDLGAVQKIERVEIYWESGKASKYSIQVAETLTNNGQEGWTTVKTFDRHPTELNEIITLDQPTDARYVRLYIDSFTAHDPSGHAVDWNTISIYELEVYGKAGQPQPEPEAQDPMMNVARGKTAAASSIEAESVKASNAVDGNSTGKNSRWGSNQGSGPEWIYVDLGKTMDVKTVRVYWENRKATSYKIQLANTQTTPTDSDWTDAAVFNDRPGTVNQDIVLDQVQQARYVRLYISSFTSEDPDGGVTWPTVSIYELEVYGGVPAREYTLDQALAAIQVAQPAKGDAKLKVTIPQAAGMDIKYNGTDLEQVVGDDLTIFQPLVDKRVKVSFKATKTSTGEFKFREVELTIPGKEQVAVGDNQVPNTLPVIQEWKGTTGVFTVGDSAKIIYTDESLRKAAEATAQDYEIITGKTITAVAGTAEQAVSGDLVLTLDPALRTELLDEGYYMTVGQTALVKAADPTGAYYGTRTLLQSIKKDGNVPCGTARDYPEYELRSFMLDVGRKTFTMDFLEQLVQQMAWYKLNDLQVHLNDNYIWLEQLQNPMGAYSGFRLESNVKAGGNGGLNKADLTSKDVFYTKDEFRAFIQDSRTYGVDIVPEIDTPAHSLALTKVRPDLRQGTSGRQNDHLNLGGKYDQCIEFVQGIFNEYMLPDAQGKDPVFDQDTIVHVGADEYEADREAYRHFASDMLQYVKDSQRQPRIWGSLTQIHGQTHVEGEGVQIQLWNANWADMKQMYTEGFDLINCNDRDYYVVPNANYYHDYLDSSTMYNKPINHIANYSVPSGDDQMIGGMFAVWNDLIDVRDTGVSEYDVYRRIQEAMPLFASKLWGKGGKTLDQANELRQVLDDAPQTNFNYEVDSQGDAIAHYTMDDTSDSSGNGHNLGQMQNAALEAVNGRNAIKLNGGESWVNTTLPTLGLGNDLRVKVLRTSAENQEQILFESEYGSIKAVQKDTGKVGFSRENRDYSFNYQLPVNEWVELEFKNEQNRVSLYVNGQLTDVLGDGETVKDNRPLLATTMLPVSRIGSTTKAFIGYVDDLRIGKNADFNSTMELDRLVEVAGMVEGSEALTAKVAEAQAVIDQYAPEKAEIDRLAAELNTLLENTEYKKADYTRVDKYVALVPEDLTQFTPASVQALEAALAGVQRDLPATMQAKVDQQAENIHAALAALELKSAQDMAFVDPATMTATASSYQKDGSSPDKVLDGKLDTMWHTDWGITTMPHWIDLEMAQPTAVDGLVYTPRQGNSNGRATSFRIEKSDDGQHYTEVISGTWADSNATKEIRFDPVVTKHIRLVILAAGNNNGSAVEIRLSAARTVADVEGLNQLIAKADGLTQAEYTPESWAQMQTVLTRAKAAAQAQPPVVDDVETAKRDLAKAMTNLTVVEELPGQLFTIAGSSVVLGSSLKIRFAVREADLKGNTKVHAIITQTYADGREPRVRRYVHGKWSDPKEGLHHMTFEGIAAKEMGDEITIQVFDTASGEPLSELYSISIKQYARRLLDDPKYRDDQTVKTMVADLLNYGTAAQVQFQYDVEHPVNAILTDEEKGMATEHVTPVDHRVPGLNYFTTTLSLDDSIVLNLYFKGIEDATVAEVTFTDHGGYTNTFFIENYEFKQSGTPGVMVVPVSLLAVADGRQLVKCVVKNGDTVLAEASDSIEGYAARALQSPKASAQLKIMVTELMEFVDSADKYFKAHP